jgi:hypothetical protein
MELNDLHQVNQIELNLFFLRISIFEALIDLKIVRKTTSGVVSK